MAENLLEIRHLSIAFGGLKAVDDVSVNIPAGSLYGLVGPNGAGKTTVFNMLTGVYKPTSGEILLEGKHIEGHSQRQINHMGIARTFQNIRLFNNMSVIRNVMVALSSQKEYVISPFTSMLRLPKFYKIENAMTLRAKQILKIFGLYEDRNNLACNLPYGKQRKLEIARALATNPKLLLLDEPAAGMNPQETAELADIIRFIQKEFDITILLIEHDMHFVSDLCEKLTVLNFGKMLAQGETEKVLADKEVIRAYIGN